MIVLQFGYGTFRLSIAFGENAECVMCMCDKYETDDEESEAEYEPECKCESTS